MQCRRCHRLFKDQLDARDIAILVSRMCNSTKLTKQFVMYQRSISYSYCYMTTVIFIFMTLTWRLNIKAYPIGAMTCMIFACSTMLVT